MHTRTRRFDLYFGLHVAMCLLGGLMCMVSPGVLLDPWNVPAGDPLIISLTFWSGAHTLAIGLLSGVMLRGESARMRHAGALALVIWNGLVVYADILIGRATGGDTTGGIALHGAWAVWGLILLVAFREPAAAGEAHRAPRAATADA